MTSTGTQHRQADSPGAQGSALTVAPELVMEVRCHRRRQGPYTGGRDLLRVVATELAQAAPQSLATGAVTIMAITPELASLVPHAPRTLTSEAATPERTRLYSAVRTRRLAHGVAELVSAWARTCHPGGAVISFRELDQADPTDQELVSILLRRCDPNVVTLVRPAAAPDGALADAPPAAHPAGTDLAQLYLDSDGISPDPGAHAAWMNLDPGERARRHSARAAELAARGPDAPRLGALLYHLERGDDPAAAAAAFETAVEDCFSRGFYEATLDLALRGRQRAAAAERADSYWNLTVKASACLSYLDRAGEAARYIAEIRRGTTDPDRHMSSCYLMAMLFTRYLNPDVRDEDEALGWANTAIALSDVHPDPSKRVIAGAFMRNARALVELHRGDAATALTLVNESIARTDAGLGPEEHLLHRSVLRYNRAQIMARSGDPAAALRDYDEVIRRDPEYGDYYFERAGAHSALGQLAAAEADYTEAIRLSPPFFEAHFNRAGVRQERDDADGALRDLDYVLELEPDHLDSLVNRVDLWLERGEAQRAGPDIDRGLALAPRNVNLLCARGTLLAESGDGAAALDSFTAALTEDPQYVPAWANRAAAGYAGGDLAAAVSDLDRAIELADDPWLRANRALALHDLGEHARALDDLDLAIAALGDADPDLLDRRAACRSALGQERHAHS